MRRARWNVLERCFAFVAWLLRGRCLFNRGNRAMAQRQAANPAPRLRDHATHEESSLESVYKFMIMTSLLHISVTYRVLLSFLRRCRRRCFRSARSRRIYQRYMLSAFYLSAHCASCAPNGTTTRFCIYIQPFVIVCRAARATFGFCRIGRTDGLLRRIPFRHHSETRKRITRCEYAKRERAVRAHFYLLFFLFNARFGRMRRVNLVARV